MSQQVKMVDVSTIIDKIIAATLTRHAKMSEVELMKDLKIEKPKCERIELRHAKFNLMNAILREILVANDKIKLIDQTFQLVCKDDNKKTGE